MNTQPTPETNKISQWSDNHGWIIDIEHARKLERERDEAREELATVTAQRDMLVEALEIAANRFRYPEFGCNWEDVSKEIESALQSLTPNTKL
jgi:hypothetical protein